MALGSSAISIGEPALTQNAENELIFSIAQISTISQHMGISE